MKRTAILIVVLALMLPVSSAFAKPEKIQIKGKGRQSREVTARERMKNMDLRNIEDPEARRAIREILVYLDLPYKS